MGWQAMIKTLFFAASMAKLKQIWEPCPSRTNTTGAVIRNDAGRNICRNHSQNYASSIHPESLAEYIQPVCPFSIQLGFNILALYTTYGGRILPYGWATCKDGIMHSLPEPVPISIHPSAGPSLNDYLLEHTDVDNPVSWQFHKHLLSPIGKGKQTMIMQCFFQHGEGSIYDTG